MIAHFNVHHFIIEINFLLQLRCSQHDDVERDGMLHLLH